MTPRETRVARVAILGTGAIGLLVAARTAAFYVGVDRIALSLSVLIGVGLAIGIAELLARVGRAERTLGELTKLPRPATLEAIDATSPDLRAVLRARLSGVRASLPGGGFASHLVGLLVMAGLLGTFLGLVEALRSTRDVLGTSGDIDTLRGALATPMLGLSRAFGTSAAGLCASAMLGLASVFARRVEASLNHAVQAYGDAALGPLTIAERQIALLETLVRQQVEATAAATRVTDAVEATATALRADLAVGVADVGRAVERALTPALERAVARASEVTRERLDDWTRVLEREADARRARDEALAAAWTDAAGQSADRVAREGARVLGELRGSLGETLVSLDGRLGASIDALAARLGDRTQEITGDLEGRLGALTTTVDAMVRGLSGELEGTRARLDRTLEATTEALDAHAERSMARERAREDATSARIAELAEAEARAMTRLERHVGAVDAALATHLERMTALHTEASRDATQRAAAREDAMTARAAELAEAEARALSRLERHVDAVDAALATHLERLTTLQAEASREATQRAAALEVVLRDRASGLTAEAAELLAEAARRADAATIAAEQAARAAREEIATREASERAQAARAEAVLSGLASAAEQVSTRAGEVLTTQAERQAELEARLLEAREAAERAQAARAEAVLSGLATAAEQVSTRAGAVLTSHAERQAELEARLLEAREAAERAQAARAEAVLSGLATAAEQVSTRAGEVLTTQAERQAALEAKWLEAHDASAARLVALLEQHASGLAQGLTATRSLVDEAAGLLRASGVEMGAVAEVFTGAVDRYRDASAATLTALASVDESVDRAGKKAAVDLLTDYLDQTREVFEHSLEVQRELFAELRALRSRAQAGAGAEKTSVRA